MKKHCEKNHQSHDKYEGPKHISKPEELKAISFMKIQRENVASLAASCELSRMIAMSGKCYAEGAFIKQCTVKTAETVCPEKAPLFKDIPLNRNSIC